MDKRSSAWPCHVSPSDDGCRSSVSDFFCANDIAGWITSDEAFKALLQTAPPGKRDYYNSIRAQIQRYKREHECSRFWLFSLRDDRSVLMSFFERL